MAAVLFAGFGAHAACTVVTGRVNGDISLRLPFRDGEAYSVSQGYCCTCTDGSHTGYEVDLRLPLGTPVVATAAGTVYDVRDYSGNCPSGCADSANDAGTYVKLRHQGATTTWYSSYLHLSSRSVNVGASVTSGQIIGYSGNTGWSTGAHLHFHMRNGPSGSDTGFRPVPIQGTEVETGASPIQDFVQERTYRASSSGQADLTVLGAVLVSPSSVVPGGTVRVDWTEKNQGTAASTPAHNTKIFLSTSAYGTTYQIGYYSMYTLGAGASQSYYVPAIVVPASTPAGDYYVTAFVDCDQQVSEGSNENNNIGSSTPTRLTVVAQTGSLQVTISPAGAVSAGAQWQVNGGAWQNSGTTISGLTVGPHSVAFKPVSGWTTPGNQSVTIYANQTTTTTGTYAQERGPLQVTISPAGAVSAGAQWQVDSGAWQNSGATVPDLAVGPHTVAFKLVSGWATPGNQTVTIYANQTTTATGIYTSQPGSLQVTISPVGAVSAGAQWQVDGGTWQNSEATVSGLATGLHTVTFKPVSGWATPGNQSVTIYANQTTTTTGTYAQERGSLQVTISPAGAVSAGAQWQVDGGAWQNSGATVPDLAVGVRTLAFKPVGGWVTPGNQVVSIYASQTASAAGTYSPIGELPKQLTQPAWSNGVFRFVLNGLVGSNYVIQVSSNLVNWSVLLTNVIPAGGSRVIDLPIQTNKPIQFYRALPLRSGPLVLQPGPVDGKDIWTTSVYSYAPDGSFPGGGLNDDKLRVGGWADEYYSLLQFDLSGLPATAGSAVLYLYCYNQSGGGTTMYLDRITQAWDWRTQGTGRDRDRLWWADRPLTTQWSAGEIPNPTQGQWYAVDITTLYNAWQAGTYPNFGVQFRPVNFFNNNFNEFYSADYPGDPTLRPMLRITGPGGGANVIATNLNSITSLVPDGAYLYFADPTSVDGILKRVPKTGGGVSILATGLATSDGHSPSFVVNSGTIYGGYGGYNAYNMFSLQAGGGTAATLVSTTGGTFFGVAGSQICYGSGFSYLNSIPISGGSPTQLAANNWVRSSAVDSGAVYFVEYFSRDVRKCSLPSGTVTPLITGNASEGSIFIDAANVYFNRSGSILAVSKSGGAVTPLVSSGGAMGYASDGANVFFVENDTLKSIPVGGGSVSPLISLPPNSFTSLALDDAFIYWGDNGGGVGAGKIWRMSKP